MKKEEIRERQIAQFFSDYKSELLKIALFLHWGSVGFELKNWCISLLPDGFECPPSETYAELQNALRYWQSVVNAEEK